MVFVNQIDSSDHLHAVECSRIHALIGVNCYWFESSLWGKTLFGSSEAWTHLTCLVAVSRLLMVGDLRTAANSGFTYALVNWVLLSWFTKIQWGDKDYGMVVSVLQQSLRILLTGGNHHRWLWLVQTKWSIEDLHADGWPYHANAYCPYLPSTGRAVPEI